MVIINILRDDDYHCDIWSLGATSKQFYEDVALVFVDNIKFSRLIIRSIGAHSRYNIHKDLERIERNDNMITILKGAIAHRQYSFIQESFKTTFCERLYVHTLVKDTFLRIETNATDALGERSVKFVNMSKIISEFEKKFTIETLRWFLQFCGADMRWGHNPKLLIQSFLNYNIDAFVSILKLRDLDLHARRFVIYWNMMLDRYQEELFTIAAKDQHGRFHRYLMRRKGIRDDYSKFLHDRLC